MMPIYRGKKIHRLVKYAVKNIVKNSLGVAGVIVVVYILAYFNFGSAAREKIQGSWVCIDTSRTYVFTGNEYSYGADSGSFRIRGNKITFLPSGRGYPVRVARDYLVIDGIQYLRKE